MKNFANNELSMEQQIAIRFYNLEQTYKKKYFVKFIMMALAGNKYTTYDDEFWQLDKLNVTDMMYIQAVTIVKYFGKDLTTRMISFNYGEEVDAINKELAA